MLYFRYYVYIIILKLVIINPKTQFFLTKMFWSVHTFTSLLIIIIHVVMHIPEKLAKYDSLLSEIVFHIQLFR